jgi:hypothetical protein
MSLTTQFMPGQLMIIFGWVQHRDCLTCSNVTAQNFLRKQRIAATRPCSELRAAFVQNERRMDGK